MTDLTLVQGASSERSPRTPSGLLDAGKRLWRKSVTAFDLEDHELELLRQACHTADRIDQLRAAVDKDGLMIPSSQGDRLHPAVAEERSQRLALARLLATLALPAEADLPKARPARGVYAGPR